MYKDRHNHIKTEQNQTVCTIHGIHINERYLLYHIINFCGLCRPVTHEMLSNLSVLSNPTYLNNIHISLVLEIYIIDINIYHHKGTDK